MQFWITRVSRLKSSRRMSVIKNDGKSAILTGEWNFERSLIGNFMHSAALTSQHCLYQPTGDLITYSAEARKEIEELIPECTTNNFSPFIETFFSMLRNGGSALDLGCGQKGSYATRFLEKGWHVVAMDKRNVFAPPKRVNFIWESAKPYLKNDSLRFIQADILIHPLDEQSIGKFNVVSCMCVFPYLPFDQLGSLLVKIHAALVDDGLFLGSLFCKTKQSLPVPLRVLCSQGTLVLKDEKTMPRILKQFHFEVVSMKVTDMDKNGITLQEFIAKRLPILSK